MGNHYDMHKDYGSLTRPQINYSKTPEGKAHYTLTGEHGGFQAYELYINKNAIYTYSPGRTPCALTI